jgi:leucine dehydrogenase
MTDLIDLMQEEGVSHCMTWADPESGLKAILVVDDVTLGPAAGGVRIQPYPSFAHALRDAASLARAMTLKCSLAGLPAGGGKIVVMEHGELQREKAFEFIGRKVEELGGFFRTGSDLGTTTADLQAMSRFTQYVHTAEERICDAVAHGVIASIRACLTFRPGASLAGLKVAVQGCGAVGAAVTRALARAGAELCIADVDPERAQMIAKEVGARVCPPEEILKEDVDVISPNAGGGVITRGKVDEIRAWAICGGANNILAGSDVARVLHDKGILYIPDFLSSAGGVIDGIARDVMKLEDPMPLVERVGAYVLEILSESQEKQMMPVQIATERALHRISQSAPIQAPYRSS